MWIQGTGRTPSWGRSVRSAATATAGTTLTVASELLSACAGHTMTGLGLGGSALAGTVGYWGTSLKIYQRLSRTRMGYSGGSTAPAAPVARNGRES